MSLIIPVFIMNQGCPHRCLYCDETTTAGNLKPPQNFSDFQKIIESYLKSPHEQVEIAFYGGNFTGLDENTQRQYLEWAQEYIDQKKVHSIRISTRPDAIHVENLKLLKKHSVTHIELGAQSLVNRVLQAIQRGHSAEDVVNAVHLIQSFEIKVGLHLMLGLPTETFEDFQQSVDQCLELRPNTLRIHPTLVLHNTQLANLYHDGKYKPLSLDQAIEWLCWAVQKIQKTSIKLIRLGLQNTPELEDTQGYLAGPYHPNLKVLVFQKIYLEKIIKYLEGFKSTHKEYSLTNLSITAHQNEIHYVRGYKNENIEIIKNKFSFKSVSVNTDRDFNNYLLKHFSVHNSYQFIPHCLRIQLDDGPVLLKVF